MANWEAGTRRDPFSKLVYVNGGLGGSPVGPRTARLIVCERPETQVTLRTGHIGDTLPLNVGSQGMGFGEGDSESQAF